MTPFPRGVGPTASLGAGHGALDSHPPVPIELRRDPSPRHCPPSGLEISPPQPPQSIHFRVCRLLLVGAQRQPRMPSAPGLLCPHLDFVAWSFLPVSPNTFSQHSRHFTTLPYPLPLAAHSPPSATTSSPLCPSSSFMSVSMAPPL